MATELWHPWRVIVIAEEVQDALSEGRGVVALESTIIAHGLPFPDNLALAKELEATIRSCGAVPATIAVQEGRACVGLTAQELSRLASPDADFAKAGALDLAAVLAQGADAATTVSATSILAAAAGIRLFATGGIGGVHRGDDFDVSADLLSLSQVPVAVVSAGPKAILDLPRTAEALESLAVLVLGYGTDELPAFYCRESGIALEHRVDTPAAAAKALHIRWTLLKQGGVLVANPVPKAHALAKQQVEGWIEEAHRAAEEAGIGGKKLTPFLLKYLARCSGGNAVETNCALALHNAEVAAKIAVAYGEIPRD
jgi:pseudouridine-5'-phosphate glycosidase